MNSIEKKKILFIIWSYTYGGGSEALLTMIVNHLNPKKYDISILEYEHSDVKIEPVNSNICVLPPIEKIETPDRQKKGYQVYNTPEVLIQQYVKGNYDLYVSFNYQIPTFLLPSNTKNIAWIHGDVYDLANDTAKREWMLQDKAFDKVKKIVAITEFTERSLSELFPRHKDKIIKIYNGIDLSDVRGKAKQKAEIILNENSIISVARLDENKDPLRLLRIFKRVHQVREEVQLYYIGEGMLRKRLQQEIEKQGLEGCVHLLGYITNPYPVMGQAKVLCLMSKAEGLPLCVMEALALDVPFVSTAVGGCGTLSNEQRCGKLISTDEQAVKAILELLDMKREQVKRECRKSIERFALETYISRIEDLFDSVMNEEDMEL